MSPTEILRAEHVSIKAMIGILLTMRNRIDSGVAVDSDDLRQVVEFLKVYADGMHHAKEEDLLFEIMESAGIAEAHDLIGTLHSEHTLARMFLDSLSDAVMDYSNGETGAGGLLKESADGYAELLLHHICREDDILFPLADTSLSEEHKLQLREAFDKAEADPDKVRQSANQLAILVKLKDVYPISPDSAIGRMITPKSSWQLGSQ